MTAPPPARCFVCLGPVEPPGGGSRSLGGLLCCAKCAALHEQALQATTAWRHALKPGTTLACSACGKTIPIDDVREDRVVFFNEKLHCRLCAKNTSSVLLGVVRPKKVVEFARIKAAPEPRSGALGVALLIAAILLAGGALGYALVHHAPGVAPVSPEQRAAEKARAAAEKALGLATRTAESFEKACATLAQVSALAAENKGLPETDVRFEMAVQRATRARDGFAPAIASRLIEQAAAELKKADHPEEALAVLERFPKELEGTAAAADLASARASYEALRTCRRTALQLLALPGAEGFGDMDSLMASPEAAACNFAQTELGQKIDAERRRRRNTAAVSAATVPVTPADSRTAAWAELKFDLAEAEAQYLAIARRDPTRADAPLGLARIYLERDRLDLARPYAEDGVRLAPNRADAIQVQGWLEWLSANNDAWDRTARTIGSLRFDWLNRHGRRLRWLLDLGQPLQQASHVRVFGRGFGAEQVADTAADADAAAGVAAQALSVPEGSDRIDLLLFASDAEKEKFIPHLELRGVTHEGVLLGCSAVTPNGKDLNAVRLAVAAGVARRAPGAAPEWLVAALPYAISARPPAGPLRVKLAELERLDSAAVLTRADAWATALELSSLCYTEDGREALAAYVSARKEGAAPRARTALEQAHARLGSR